MKTIILDMYGVIIKESKGNFIPYVYKHFPSADKALIKNLFPKAQLGEIDSNRFLLELGFKDTAFHMRDYIENYLKVDEGFYTFAEKFKDHFRIVLLSNDVSDWSRYITEHYKLNKYFDEKIISADVHCRKPDSEIFITTLDRLGVPAEDCVYIDNSVCNLLAARKLGMETILFDRDGEVYNGKAIYMFEELSELLEQKLWL